MSGALSTTPVAETNIEVGHHITVTIAGLTFNVDTIYSSLIAGAVVVGLGLWVARKASAKHPTRAQLAWEQIITYLTNEVESSLGKVDRYVVELSVALFTFILVSNWLEVIPSGDDPKILAAPTADVNLTYALALIVIVGVHLNSVKQKGARGYFSYYSHGPKILIPLTVIEEIVKPFTLALRLFGNIFAGGIMLAIIGLIPIWGAWAPTLIWKLFDMFIGLIQAFIFALLTIIYYGMMGHPSDDHADPHQPAGSTEQETAGSTESETAQPALSGAH